MSILALFDMENDNIVGNGRVHIDENWDADEESCTLL